MSGFLSESWFAALEDAAGRARVPEELRLTVQQVVTDGPDGEIAYAIVVGGGAIRVRRGHLEGADVRFTEDYATAIAVHEGSLSAQAAFMRGRLRVAGDLRLLLDRANELATIDDVLAGARA